MALMSFPLWPGILAVLNASSTDYGLILSRENQNGPVVHASPHPIARPNGLPRKGGIGQL